MRVLIMAKEGEQSETESAASPTPEAMAEYQKFNEELVKAGVVLEAGRLSRAPREGAFVSTARSAPSSTGRSAARFAELRFLSVQDPADKVGLSQLLE